MHPFIPNYQNPGGQSLINTHQKRHILAVLNAKPCVQLPGRSLPAQKRPSSARPGCRFELTAAQGFTHKMELSALVHNLVQMDRRAFAAQKVLRRNLRLLESQKPRKKKDFFVSKFHGGDLQRAGLDRLLRQGGKSAGKGRTGQKQGIHRINPKNSKTPLENNANLPAKPPTKHGRSVLFDGNPLKTNKRVSLNIDLGRKADKEMYSSVKFTSAELRPETAAKNSALGGQEVAELLQGGINKRKILEIVVKYRLTDKASFLRLKTEVLQRAELGSSLGVQNILDEIQNYIIK